MKRIVLGLCTLVLPLGGLAASRAPEPTPGSAADFTHRGNAKAARGDLDGAAADYTEALARDPDHLAARLNRGAVRQRQGNFPAAQADDTAVLARDPRNVAALYNRAGARRAAGDLDGARADYAHVLALAPDDVGARLNRAVVALAQRDWPGAEADLRRALRLIPEEQQVYPRIYLWVTKAEQGDAAGAARDLGRALDHGSARFAHTWPGRIESFLAGRIDEARFRAFAEAFAAARERGQRSQADYYAGLKRAAAGDRDGAAKCFAAASGGDRALHEVVLAGEKAKRARGPRS